MKQSDVQHFIDTTRAFLASKETMKIALEKVLPDYQEIMGNPMLGDINEIDVSTDNQALYITTLLENTRNAYVLPVRVLYDKNFLNETRERIRMETCIQEAIDANNKVR